MRLRRSHTIHAFLASALVLGAASARAQSTEVPAALKNVDVVERLGEAVPLDVPFQDENGKEVRLRDYLRPDKPLLLALVYYECPMLCNLVLDGLVKSLKGTGLELGPDYNAVALSFAQEETPEQASRRQKRHLEAMDRPDATAHWAFLSGEQPNVRVITDAVGFKFSYDASTKQYAHSAVVMILTPDGTISRYLYGIEYPPKDMKMALVEASGGKVGTSFDRFLLNCYQYDPAKRAYGWFIKGFLRTGGMLVFFALASLLFVLWRREMKKSRAGSPDESATARASGEAS